MEVRIAVASPTHRREGAFTVRADGQAIEVDRPHACCIHSQPQPASAPARHGFSPAEVAMLRQRGMTPEAAKRRLDGDR